MPRPLTQHLLANPYSGLLFCAVARSLLGCILARPLLQVGPSGLWRVSMCGSESCRHVGEALLVRKWLQVLLICFADVGWGKGMRSTTWAMCQGSGLLACAQCAPMPHKPASGWSLW